MPQIRSYHANFTAGELSDDLLARTDLRAYQNGARKLRNVFIKPTGAVVRRSGLRFVDLAKGPGRLAEFEFNNEQVYLLVFTDHVIDIYHDGERIVTLWAPWSLSQLGQLNWTQSADTLLIVHPDVPPQRLTRLADGRWDLADWGIKSEGGRMQWPHYKFAGEAVTCQPTQTTGNINIYCSQPSVFTDRHLGARIRLNNRELIVTALIPGWGISALVLEALVEPWITTDWTEQAWSHARGWPTSVCFHQDRLVVGGSRDLPNRLWMSKTGDYFNYDVGEGLDDEAIEFPVLSDQVNAIRYVFSARHLQVFTSGAEWMVSGDPLTPTSIQVHRQTRVGSPIERTIPPQDVDGATLFISRSGDQLRQFLYTDVEQAYQSSDLSLLARHLLEKPIDMAFDNINRLFHIVLANGKLATLTVYRDEQVTAWTQQTTAGAFRSVAAVGDDTFVLVERPGGFFIEMFDPDFQVDSGLSGVTQTPTRTWSGLSHLEAQWLSVVADGVPQAPIQVIGGKVTLPYPVQTAQMGLPYAHVIEPLPPTTADGVTLMGKQRLIALTLRLQGTKALSLDTGNGLTAIPLGEPPRTFSVHPFSGDKRVGVLGWRKAGPDSLWRIEQDVPAPFTLLSANAEISVSK